MVRAVATAPTSTSVGPLRKELEVFWLTGLSGAGKSTLSDAVVDRLARDGVPAIHLDGDALRSGLCSDLSFTTEDRTENIRRTAEVARLLAGQGHLVICSLISPLRVHRELARRIVGKAFVEVFVKCEVDECIRRDPKGLYAKAIAGKLPLFTGIGSPYEAPEEAELVIESGREGIAACSEALISRILRESAR